MQSFQEFCSSVLPQPQCLRGQWKKSSSRRSHGEIQRVRIVLMGESSQYGVSVSKALATHTDVDPRRTLLNTSFSPAVPKLEGELPTIGADFASITFNETALHPRTNAAVWILGSGQEYEAVREEVLKMGAREKLVVLFLFSWEDADSLPALKNFIAETEHLTGTMVYRLIYGLRDGDTHNATSPFPSTTATPTNRRPVSSTEVEQFAAEHCLCLLKEDSSNKQIPNLTTLLNPSSQSAPPCSANGGIPQKTNVGESYQHPDDSATKRRARRYTTNPREAPFGTENSSIFASMSIRQLKAFLDSIGVRSDDCLTKKELQIKCELMAKREKTKKSPGTNTTDDDRNNQRSSQGRAAARRRTTTDVPKVTNSGEGHEERVLSEVKKWQSSNLLDMINHIYSRFGGLKQGEHSLHLEPDAPFNKVSRSYKRALLLIHPDKHDQADVEAHFRATEYFKALNSSFIEYKAIYG